MSEILTACHISSPTGLLNSILGLSTSLEDEVCCRWLQYLPIKKGFLLSRQTLPYTRVHGLRRGTRTRFQSPLTLWAGCPGTLFKLHNCQGQLWLMCLQDMTLVLWGNSVTMSCFSPKPLLSSCLSSSICVGSYVNQYFPAFSISWTN